ncbi:MAG TPA: PEGA domain-containing protein [Polyangiaceae bacterium]|nr:PEGA domain-containing protein [Polyangiaceae bacterium]
MAAVVGAGVAAAPREACAQTSAAETQHVTDLFKSGKAAFAKGDMAEAERLFAEAFAIRKSSDIAANLGQAQLEQQKFRVAAEHFQWALANLLPSATDAQRKAVETGLSRSRAEVAILRLDIKPEGSDVIVGDQNLGKSPIANGVYVDAGEAIVSVKHDGYVALEKRVMVGKGTEQAVELSLTPKDGAAPAAGGSAAPLVDSGLEHRAGAGSAPAGAPADRAAPKSLVPAFVATGVAVAGGVVGLVFTLNANSKESDADKLRDQLNLMGGCSGDAAASGDCAALKSQRESVDSSRHLAVAAFVVGGVAAVAAGYFYWDALSSRSDQSAARRRPLLGLTPSVDIGRARANDAASIGSVKLSLSGNF